MDETAFRKRLADEGYETTKIFEMEPNAFNEMHIHDTDALAFVLDGEITVVTDDYNRTCRPGDVNAVGAMVTHSEQAGPDGVRLLVGLRKPAG